MEEEAFLDHQAVGVGEVVAPSRVRAEVVGVGVEEASHWPWQAEAGQVGVARPCSGEGGEEVVVEVEGVVVEVMSQLCCFDCPIEPGRLGLSPHSAGHRSGHLSELPYAASLSADHRQRSDHWTDPWRMPGVP